MRKCPTRYQQVLEKKSSEMEKPLDKPHKVWYNNNVGRGEGLPPKELRLTD